MADRQRIIENNRSLRNVKSELENLLERGVITDEAFDSIHALLPAESPLSGPAGTRALPPRQPTAQQPPKTASAFEPKAADPAPPAYSATGPPALPSRNPSGAAAAAAPEKPVLAQARALYRYEAADARDVALEKDDRVAVHEKINNDWWMGRNLRTGREGIFPKTYVEVEQESEKRMPVRGGPPQQGQGQGGVYSPEGDVGEDGSSRVNENGKKFGKKLGNAAIFGAGATIGSKIVNGIF